VDKQTHDDDAKTNILGQIIKRTTSRIYKILVLVLLTSILVLLMIPYFDNTSCRINSNGTDKVEPGFFFGAGGGRVRAERRFMVGLDFDITMMIKPRNLTGILAAVKGKRDYLLLHMVEGAIVFEVDNGRGAIIATFRPDDQHEFCNGQWHEIHAVKAKNVVTLSVNKIFAQPGIGVPGVSSTDTNNPLFLGGHIRPGRFGNSLRPDQSAYHGCMKDVVIERKRYEFSQNEIFGDISSHICPTI